MSIANLFQVRQKVSFEWNGQQVNLYIRKPNVFDEEKAREFAEKEVIKIKLRDDKKKLFETEIEGKTKEELVDMLLVVDGVKPEEFSKIEERLKEERKEFKDIDALIKTLPDLSGEELKKAQKLIEKFNKEVSREADKLIESKKETLMLLHENDLKKRLLSKLLDLQDMQAILNATIKYYLLNLVEDEEGNKVFTEETLETADQAIIDLLTEEIINIRQLGVELKKVSSKEDLSS